MSSLLAHQVSNAAVKTIRPLGTKAIFVPRAAIIAVAILSKVTLTAAPRRR